MILNKFVIHILDKNSDVPILNDYEGKISIALDSFFQKTIKKVCKNDSLRLAKFNNYNDNLIKKCCEQIIYNEKSFLENSKEIASYLFETMQLQADIQACDLAVCLFNDKDEKYVAILMLDYKKIYNHSLEFEDEKFNIQMKVNEIGITDTTSIRFAAVVGANRITDEWQLKILEKDAEKTEEDLFFTKDFLNAIKIEDDTYKTKVFKNATDNFLNRMSFENNLKEAESIRELRDHILKNNSVMDIEKFIENANLEHETSEQLLDYLENYNITDSFNIDKEYIEKKLKKRTIKTENGFNITGNLENFNDYTKFSMTENEDGTWDLTIKNVKSIEDR